MAYCVSITKAGSPSVLKIQDIEMPVPKEGEVCVEVHYAGINFADTLMRLGLYQPRPPFPFTPGYEVSGVIHSLGDGVTEFEVGQRIVAAMPVTYLTAHHMLHYLGHLKKGETVLIHGGAGGVGTAALQLCQWAGIEQVWATASGHKSDIITSFGGIPIDRHNEDFTKIVKDATNGRGVDHILDPIGGDNLARSLGCLAEGGKLYTYGLSSAAPTSKRSLLKAFFALRKTPKFDALRLMTRNRGVFGVHMGTWKDEEAMATQLHRIMEGVKGGHLKPVIDSVFDAKDVAKAHQHIHDAKNIGKVLLRFAK